MRGIVARFTGSPVPTIPVPIIIRLQGTNAAEAKALIDGSDLSVYSAIGLKEASELVRELID